MKFRKDLSSFPLSTSKMDLKGDRFANVGSIKEAIAENLKNIPETDFSRAVKKQMGYRARNCVKRNSNYFE